MPKFLENMMRSSEYRNRDSATIDSTNQWMKTFYPGNMKYDETGRMVEPDYDMTKDEFDAAKDELDSALSGAIDEAKADFINSQDEAGVPANQRNDPDFEQYIILDETIPVRVLYPDGTVIEDSLEIYTLDLPEEMPYQGDDPNTGDDEEEIWVWSDDGECEACAEMAGTILDSEEIPTPHLNCNCTAVRMTRKEYNDQYGDADPDQQEKYQQFKTEKRNLDMKSDVLSKEFKKDVMNHEGVKTNPYVDTKNNITIGVGNNVNDLKSFTALNLTNTKTGEILTNSEKTELYNQIQADIDSRSFSERNYSYIQVSQNDIMEKFDEQLNRSYNEIAGKIDNFDNLPTPAKQALVDMQLNMGSGKFNNENWPKLFAAVERQDWTAAAKEGSERKDVQQSRRDWTQEHFMMAAGL